MSPINCQSEPGDTPEILRAKRHYRANMITAAELEARIQRGGTRGLASVISEATGSRVRPLVHPYGSSEICCRCGGPVDTEELHWIDGAAYHSICADALEAEVMDQAEAMWASWVDDDGDDDLGS